ncbi:hypothetical protein [Rathayibacter iranicus]|uniref:Uncharacterized protein n=1 Tax=Rathayibacter iranicus TaxID=59737 RepID=A0AAD1ABQ5_9MICO|nr:hypothetical protein [Rathayibacter iranicus]AZZ54457.1 hypothetical protein C7V51_00035 [Rathayibacter iranicus]
MSGGDEVDEVAAVVQRLAVLLAAGSLRDPRWVISRRRGLGARAARRRRLLRAVAEEAARGGDVSVALLRDVRPHDGRPARQAVV